MEKPTNISLGELAPGMISAIDAIKSSYGAFETHPSLRVERSRVDEVLSELVERLENNFPYFHPNYAGQMLKPPHPVAMAAYVATMMINPNNQSIDGGKATTLMEREVMAQLAAMFNFPTEFLGHLTWSGTTANLEALWVGRELNPLGAIAHSEDAHYTHSRMGEVLNCKTIAIPSDSSGRMDLNALEERLKAGEIGTVVATLGTTGLGAVDPLADIIPLAKLYGARVHVDTAYGGFFSIIAEDYLDEEAARHYAAIKDADSIVVDPHKHGLQPYGCGAVLFRDYSVGKFYKHDSPYTYFASKDLHYGEIQLECSRAGASAAALWATLKVFPLTVNGLGQVLLAARRAALRWFDLAANSEVIQPLQRPELDIFAYFARTQDLDEIDRISQSIFEMSAQGNREDQLHLATYMMKRDGFERRNILVGGSSAKARVLRSVLMKPEQEFHVEHLHARVESLAGKLLSNK